MWKQIVEKNKNLVIASKSKKKPKIKKIDEIRASKTSLEDFDEIDYFDLYYYGELESHLSNLLYTIQNGPVFKYGNTYDILEYIKSKCNLDKLNNKHKMSSTNIMEEDKFYT